MDKNELDLVVGLMGSTFGELKQLDSSIIGSSPTLNRRSDEVKKQLADVLKQGLPQQVAPQPQPTQQQPFFNQSQPNYQFVELPTQPVIQPVNQQSFDPNQMELDLNKTAKYDDVINKLDEVMVKLKNIEQKIDNLKVENLRQKKKKVSGTQSGSDYNQ